VRNGRARVAIGALVAVVIGAGVAGTILVVNGRRTTPVPPLSDCAGVVRVVSSERITEEDADRVAGGLGECLARIGAIAYRQYGGGFEHEADPEGFGRPKVTRLFGALVDDEDLSTKLRASFVDWSRRSMASFVSGPPVERSTGRLEVYPMALVLASVANALDPDDEGPGAAFIRDTVRDVRFDLAARVADAEGRPPPRPGDVKAVLAPRFVVDQTTDGPPVPDTETPLDFLADRAIDEAERNRADTWW
jgi:hypothetical protein